LFSSIQNSIEDRIIVRLKEEKIYKGTYRENMFKQHDPNGFDNLAMKMNS
jgi:hypothetical protein